jgi:hypothetical protein
MKCFPSLKKPTKNMEVLSVFFLKLFSDDFEILWRFARAHFMKSEIVPYEKQYDVLVAGQKLALKCIDIDKKHYAGYKWFEGLKF